MTLKLCSSTKLNTNTTVSAHNENCKQKKEKQNYRQEHFNIQSNNTRTHWYLFGLCTHAKIKKEG